MKTNYAMTAIAEEADEIVREYPETALNELAAALGVPPEAIKEQRKSLKLARGVDYDLVKNNVVFSDEGMKKIVEALAVS